VASGDHGQRHSADVAALSAPLVAVKQEH
jgi:hypothetical protein